MAPQKNLQRGSDYNKYDVDGNGMVSDDELEDVIKIEELERANKKQFHQRMMAWYSLIGMISYPACIIFCEWVGLPRAADLLKDIAPTYFIAAAGIAGTFMGVTAWMDKK